MNYKVPKKLFDSILNVLLNVNLNNVSFLEINNLIQQVKSCTMIQEADNCNNSKVEEAVPEELKTE